MVKVKATMKISKCNLVHFVGFILVFLVALMGLEHLFLTIDK